jgi:hypothetical protein
MTETYGPRSFLYEWLEGIAAAEDHVVFVTNIDLEARAIDGFIPANATRAEARRLRNAAAALRKEKQVLQNRIREEYEAAHHKNSKIATSRQPAGVRARAEQRKALYAKEKTKMVVSRVSDEAEFATPNEVRACKLKPLFSRALHDRLEFWRQALDGNVLASHVGRGLAIVDIR